MNRSKRNRWSENEGLACVHEPDLKEVVAGGSYMRGRWGHDVFGNDKPIVLELGCGQGLFSVDLARRYPDRNFVGVDVKGHRFWRGARTATDDGVGNVAFLRARIQWLDRFFGSGEVDEIWLTFSDPQLADKRGTKRLTSPYYQRLYRHVLARDGVLHVKTDSKDFHGRTVEDTAESGMTVLESSNNVHGEPADRFPAELTTSLAFITAFELRWIREGRRIHYASLQNGGGLSDDDLAEALAMLQGPPERNRPRRPKRLRSDPPRER